MQLSTKKETMQQKKGDFYFMWKLWATANKTTGVSIRITFEMHCKQALNTQTD